MIPYEKAFSIVMAQARRTSATETCALTDAVGRILAEDIVASRDIPPFDRVAVDGYACRRADIGDELEIAGILAAGHEPVGAVSAGRCIKVMTGAILPAGADMVFMVEDARESSDGRRVRFTGDERASRRTNYAPRGEDRKKGAVVLGNGTRIAARHITILASLGLAQVPVRVRPLVGVLATGDELVEPGADPLPHQIMNSNAYQLMAQLRDCGVLSRYFGIVKDDRESLTRAIGEARDACDLIILSGGVSAGDFDLVPQAFAANGYATLFDRVAIKPGKPTTFAVAGERALFGLPGNPVSVFITFELLVRPFLSVLTGAPFEPRIWRLPLGEATKRADAERDTMVLVRLAEGQVFPIPNNGSGDYTTLAAADGLIRLPAGSPPLTKGTPVDVRSF
ncbi:MAG TPA: molybdopterin molybdotransferase MoeA [bacterium]|nr:molybdopterin molybdotransferase MoeA [bacterium]